MIDGKVEDPVQTVLGKYEIRDKISTGPMSTVYDGWDTAINRRVAIKAVPLAQDSQSEEWQHLTCFRRKAQAAGQLQHPTVVAIFNYGETAEHAFIITEFVDGGTLESAIESGTRFSIADINRLMQDILTGLQYSHSRGIVHRDIKPANIMLTSDGHAKISDFGIARVENSDITQVGMIMGTPAYMSPEQFRGETIGPGTDIYSAGVILYQLLTSERPFDGGLATVMHKALSTEPPKPSDISRTAPRSVDDIVARAMAKQPDQRFKDAKGFAQALQEALVVKPAAPATRSIAAQRVHGPLKRSTRPSYIHPVAAALLTALAATGGMAAYWMLAPHAAPKMESAVRPPVPPPSAMAASPSPAKPKTQANIPPAAAGPDLPSEPPAASREVPSALPPYPAVVPPRPDPDFLAPGQPPMPTPYPMLQPPLPPSAPNALTDITGLPRAPQKDARTPPRRPVGKQPFEKANGGPASQAPPFGNRRAERRPKDDTLELDASKPAEADTAPVSRLRIPPQEKSAAPPRTSRASDAYWQRGLSPEPPGAVQSPSVEHDSTPGNPVPAPPPDAIAPPKMLGRMGMVDGVRRFIPAEPDRPN